MPPKRKRTAGIDAENEAEVAPPAAAKKNTKRKEVTIAKDADRVLQKCRELKEKLIQKAAAAPELPDSSDDNNDEALSLEEILPAEKMASIPKNIIEVSDLNAREVLEGMEHIALGIANQVLGKQGITMEIPSRASSNQIYIKEWDRIVLGNKTSKRNFLHVKDSRKAAITLRVMQLIQSVVLKAIHVTKRDLFYTDVKLFVNQVGLERV